jgi:Bacterial mobilisation protein (MobC)
MARYDRAYDGERRTQYVGFQLTPSERDELEAAAAAQGASLSVYARELLFRRSAAVVAATRRNPEADALMRVLDAAGHEQNAIGNNLNQIARHLNSSGDLRDWEELRHALALYAKAAERHIEALERVLAL